MGTANADSTDGLASSVWTDHLPSADVEKVDQNDALNDAAEFNLLELAMLAYAGQSATAVKQRQETLDAIVEEVDLLE